MINPTEMYGDAFFANRAEKYGWRAPIAAQSIIKVFSMCYDRLPTTAYDVGGAVGDVVQGYVDEGLNAHCLEASAAAEQYAVCDPARWHQVDLRQPINPCWFSRVDFLTCFEVLEHLEPEAAEQAINNLTRLSHVCITSACPPHPTRAPTKYHLNEQPPEYWDALFQARNYQRHHVWEDALRAIWYPWRKKYGIAAWWQNLLVYTLGGK